MALASEAVNVSGGVQRSIPGHHIFCVCVSIRVMNEILFSSEFVPVLLYWCPSLITFYAILMLIFWYCWYFLVFEFRCTLRFDIDFLTNYLIKISTDLYFSSHPCFPKFSPSCIVCFFLWTSCQVSLTRSLYTGAVQLTSPLTADKASIVRTVRTLLPDLRFFCR